MLGLEPEPTFLLSPVVTDLLTVDLTNLQFHLLAMATFDILFFIHFKFLLQV